MNRDDATDRLTEQVHAIDFAACVATPGRANGVAAGRHADANVASRFDLDGHRWCPFQRWHCWLADMAPIIRLATYPQAALNRT
jgi:hypothetical protein